MSHGAKSQEIRHSEKNIFDLSKKTINVIITFTQQTAIRHINSTTQFNKKKQITCNRRANNVNRTYQYKILFLISLFLTVLRVELFDLRDYLGFIRCSSNLDEQESF